MGAEYVKIYIELVKASPVREPCILSDEIGVMNNSFNIHFMSNKNRMVSDDMGCPPSLIAHNGLTEREGDGAKNGRQRVSPCCP